MAERTPELNKYAHEGNIPSPKGTSGSSAERTEARSGGRPAQQVISHDMSVNQENKGREARGETTPVKED